jgi:hypothetical protein
MPVTPEKKLMHIDVARDTREDHVPSDPNRLSSSLDDLLGPMAAPEDSNPSRNGLLRSGFGSAYPPSFGRASSPSLSRANVYAKVIQTNLNAVRRMRTAPDVSVVVDGSLASFTLSSLLAGRGGH